jgi:hypothetical protein
MFRLLSAALVTALLSIPPAFGQSDLTFAQLPSEVRDHATQVRAACKEENAELKFSDMQGIQILSLKGDGARDIVVDNEGLCGVHLAGANCSNRGCDLAIYKEVTKGRWRKVFGEHVHDKFLAIDWEQMRLQLMIAVIYAGDKRCQPNPNRIYTSGMSCNLIVTWRGDGWNWQLIR